MKFLTIPISLSQLRMYLRALLVLGITVGYSHCQAYSPLLSPLLLPQPLHQPLHYQPFPLQVVSYSPSVASKSSSSSAVTPNPLLEAATYAGRDFWNCNELEQKINDERRRKGFSPLKCDPNMRWTAAQHIKNQEEAGYNGLNHWDKSCNLHSWFGDYQCCYKGDHSNAANCMWNKPYELSKWDKRRGFEISAGARGGPEGAFNLWKGSSEHYALILSSGIWSKLITVGCFWGKNLAHCWFAKELP